MIQQESYLKVADNTAQGNKMHTRFGRLQRKYGNIGDVVVASVRRRRRVEPLKR